MAVTLITENRIELAENATPAGDDLWLPRAELASATGWELKTQGMCLGDRCVPIGPAQKAQFVDAAGRFNFAAFSRYLDRPVAHDDDANVWLVGESAQARSTALQSLDAPDFRLPDLSGTMHALSDYRGKKVLLMSWASW